MIIKLVANELVVANRETYNEIRIEVGEEEKVVYYDGAGMLTNVVSLSSFVQKILDNVNYSNLQKYDYDIDFYLEVNFGDELWDGVNVCTINHNNMMSVQEITNQISEKLMELVEENE